MSNFDEKLPNFKKTYNINKKRIEMEVEVYKNKFDCYIARLIYKKEHDDYWKQTELILNGPGKSKLEKKIIRFLRTYCK